MGYSELLAEEVEGEKLGKRVAKLGKRSSPHEAHRGWSAAFRAPEQSGRPAPLNSTAALQDVVQLREYHLRKFSIALEVNVDPELPRIAIGEDELKQVLLNILNNAIDAVEDSAGARDSHQGKTSRWPRFDFV